MFLRLFAHLSGNRPAPLVSVLTRRQRISSRAGSVRQRAISLSTSAPGGRHTYRNGSVPLENCLRSLTPIHCHRRYHFRQPLLRLPADSLPRISFSCVCRRGSRTVRPVTSLYITTLCSGALEVRRLGCGGRWIGMGGGSAFVVFIGADKSCGNCGYSASVMNIVIVSNSRVTLGNSIVRQGGTG